MGIEENNPVEPLGEEIKSTQQNTVKIQPDQVIEDLNVNCTV